MAEADLNSLRDLHNSLHYTKDKYSIITLTINYRYIIFNQLLVYNIGYSWQWLIIISQTVGDDRQLFKGKQLNQEFASGLTSLLEEKHL